MTAEGVQIRLDPLDLADRALRILGSKMGSARMPHDVRMLAGWYRQGRLKLDELISARYPLEGINEAIGSNKNDAASEDPEWVKSIPNLDAGPCRRDPDPSLVWRLADGRGSSRLALGCRTVLVEKFLRPSVPPALFDDLLVMRAGTSEVVYHWHAFEMGDILHLGTLLSEDGQGKRKTDREEESSSKKKQADEKAKASATASPSAR